MSARSHPAARAAMRTAMRTGTRGAERDAFAILLAHHAPRGAVRAAEALAAAAMNRRRRRAHLWNGAFADAPFAMETVFAALPAQPASARADAAWNAICRRIAARALAGGLTGTPDPVAGAWCVVPADAPDPEQAPVLAARIDPFAFYR